MIRLIMSWLWPKPAPEPIPMPAPTPKPDPDLSGFPAYAIELLRLHNDARPATKPLELDSDLTRFAEGWARTMASRGRMGHSRLDFPGGRKSENVAVGQADAAAVFHSWITSRKGHRQTILNTTFVDVGFGMARSVGGNPYWCAVFSD